MTRLLRRLGMVEVTVPDPDATAAFLTRGIGMHVDHDGGSIGFSVSTGYGGSGSDQVLRLEEGPETTVRSIVFDVADEGLDPIETRLEETGVDVHRTPHGLGVTDPDGIAVTLRRAPPPGPELESSPLRPRRLGHVNLKVPDAAGAGRFYQDNLGLRLSEQVGDLLIFLRIAGDHHNLGFRSGAERAGLHHIAFELDGWETYRTLCDQLAALGYRVEYGPGRHGPGHNLFIYVVDPSSGLRLELFADMAHVDDDHEPVFWESVDRVRTVNVWGPQPPQSFLQ